MYNKMLLSWIFICVDIFIIGIMFYLGFVDRMMGDISHMSSVILALYFMVNLCIISKTFWVNTNFFDEMIDWVRNAFMPLGLIGTIVGLMFSQFAAFANLDIQSDESILAAIGHLSTGNSTAWVSTLAGISCFILLNLKMALYHTKKDV